MYTQLSLNISQPCTLQIGVEWCGIRDECDHHGIISAQLDSNEPVKNNLHGRGDPHEPYDFKLQRLVKVGNASQAEHTLTIRSVGDPDSILVLTGLYCTVG